MSIIVGSHRGCKEFGYGVMVTLSLTLLMGPSASDMDIEIPEPEETAASEPKFMHYHMMSGI